MKLRYTIGIPRLACLDGEVAVKSESIVKPRKARTLFLSSMRDPVTTNYIL
jgi:hypothetical protein